MRITGSCPGEMVCSVCFRHTPETSDLHRAARIGRQATVATSPGWGAHRPSRSSQLKVFGGSDDDTLMVHGVRLASVTLGALIAVFVVLPAAPVAAAQRFASALSSDTTGSCTQAAPCQLGHAIGGASAGDEVIVEPGDYAVSSPLNAPVSMDLHGVAGQPRPRLLGANNLNDATLSFKAGGTVRHLAIEASASLRDALTLESSVGEDLMLTSSGGDGAKAQGKGSTTTILRDSVVRTLAAGSGVAALKLREGGAGGDVALRNVTAIASGSGATGVRCETTVGRSTLVNVIARGDVADVDASMNGARCEASYSSFRPSLSPGLPAGTANQSQDPVFVNAAAGDFHPAPGSPTIDAGTADLLLGPSDPDGRARALGLAPDIGAFEFDPSAAPSQGQPPTGSIGPAMTAPPTPGVGSSPPPAPSLGRTVVVSPAGGVVLIKRRGHARFLPLSGSAELPVGSTVDTRRGTVRLVSAADGRGATQGMNFSAGVFSVGQSASSRGLTDIALAGSGLSSCRRQARARARSGATAQGARRKRAIRRLWGSGHGRFRTRGRYGAATVRGTNWLTEDYCDGTLVRVRRGKVAVADHHRKRTVMVRAGRSYFARASR